MRNLRPGQLSSDPVFSVEPLFTAPQFSATQLYDLVIVAHTTPHDELRAVVIAMLKHAGTPPRMIVKPAGGAKSKA